MSEKRSFFSKKAQLILRVIAAVAINLGIVFSAVYILFHLLDRYNPHGFVYHNLPWLPIAIPILFIVSVVLYDLLLIGGAYKKKRFQKKRMWLIILCDLILFAALSITMYLKTCTNPLTGSDNRIEEYRLATPNADAAASASDDPDATAAPEPTATPIPLAEKFADRFSDPPKEYSFETDHIIGTGPDGATKSLVYSYSGRNAAVDIYHFENGKLEYQFADIYIRDIACFTTDYELKAGNSLKTQHYAERIGAIVAINGDNFNSGRMTDGVVVRNGQQLFPSGGEKQTVFSRDLCVLNYDGSIRVYDCVLDRIDYDELLSSYPLHVFNFGPKLLNDDGTAMQKFNSNLGKANPRTALGYYEPGHYAFIVILGVRDVVDYDGINHGTSESPGLTLVDLSKLCEQFGFTMAYNLDGGGSASMSWDHTVFGNNDRKHGDILAIIDP